MIYKPGASIDQRVHDVICGALQAGFFNDRAQKSSGKSTHKPLGSSTCSQLQMTEEEVH